MAYIGRPIRYTEYGQEHNFTPPLIPLLLFMSLYSDETDLAKMWEADAPDSHSQSKRCPILWLGVLLHVVREPVLERPVFQTSRT